MFGDSYLNLGKSKFMSILLSGLLFVSSTLSAADYNKILTEIKKEINPDGISYSVEAKEDFDTDAEMEKIYSGLKSQQLQEMIVFYKAFGNLSKNSGFFDIDGSGSSVVKLGNYYDCDNFFHLKPGHENNLLWQVLGASKPLETMKLLPDNTILSATLSLNANSLLKFIRDNAKTINIPGGDAAQKLAEFENMATQMGLSLDEFAKTFSTELSLFLTINKGKTMTLPDAPPMPQLAATIILKKQSDFLQNLLIQNSQQIPQKKFNFSGFEVVLLNDPLPTGTKAGFAYDKDYLVISTEIEIVKGISNAIKGKGLLNSPYFSTFAKMPQTGNMAFYLDKEFGLQVSEVLKNVPEEANLMLKSLAVSFFENKNPEFFAIISKKSNGLKIDTLSSVNPSKFSPNILTTTAVVGVLAAMILPALGKAREKAKATVSKNNLKQIGTIVAIYFTDGETSTFPTDWKKMEFDENLFIHPITQKKFTLEEIFAGKGDYIPLVKSGETYTGAADKPLFMEKPNINKLGITYVVFEDGHVEGFTGKTVEEILQQIKQGNANF